MSKFTNELIVVLTAERDAARIELERLKQAVEKVATQWDTCNWEMCGDVGASIRADIAMHLRDMEAPVAE